jgi:hypothetical protein
LSMVGRMRFFLMGWQSLRHASFFSASPPFGASRSTASI